MAVLLQCGIIRVAARLTCQQERFEMTHSHSMQTRALLEDHIQNHGLCPGADTLEDWMGQDSIVFRLGGERTFKIPLGRFKRGLVAHDTHHVLTGYGTDFRGEVEAASWELASGGCSNQVAYWLDRIFLVLIGILVYPRVSIRAIRRGWGSRNLYSMTPEEILDSDVASLRLQMRI